MKNKGKSLKAKLAAVLSLVPLASAAGSQTFAMDSTPVVTSPDDDVTVDSAPETDVSDVEDQPAAPPATSPVTDTQGTASWIQSRSEVLSYLDKLVDGDANAVDQLLVSMNDPDNDSITSDPAVASLRDTAMKNSASFTDIQKNVSDLSIKIYSGGDLDFDQLDSEISDLSKRVLSEAASAKSLVERWKVLSTMLKNTGDKRKLKDDLAKMSALKQMKVRIDQILLECRTATNDLKKLDPALVGDVEVQLEDIASNVRTIQGKLLKSDRMTVKGVLDLSKQINIYFDDIHTLKTNLNEMLVDSLRLTNERVIKSEMDRISSIEKSVDVKLEIALEERQMTQSQFARLSNLKSSIRSEFSKAYKELNTIMQDLESSGKDNAECSLPDKTKWHKSVNESIRKISSLIRYWDSVLLDIQKDDVLRASWDPVEGSRLLRDKMKTKTKSIINSKELNVKQKMLQVVRSINAVQPGTGTAMLPLVRSFLDPNRSLNVTDTFGNVVADRLAPYSFQLTGVGGSGKTSGAALVAEAFDADVLMVTSNDLKDQNAFNLKKNELVTKLGAPSKKPVLVIFDEVDTGTCVVSDSSGNRLGSRPSNRYADVNPSLGVDNSSRPSNAQVLDVNGNPVRPGVWKFKYSNNSHNSAPAVNAPGGHDVFSSSNAKAPELSSHLQRDERGFSNFSELIRLLDQGPNGKVLGIVSTSNYRLDQMPAEVARRIAPTGNEVYVNTPSAKQLAEIVKIRFPGLSFSDGYGVEEGAKKIGEQAFRYGWSAPKLITNINQLANAIKDSSDPTVAIPCAGLCKLIAKTSTFQNIVDEAKAKKEAKALKAQREELAKKLSAETGSPVSVSDEDAYLNELRDELDEEFDELLNE